MNPYRNRGGVIVHPSCSWGASREGIIDTHARYNNNESRLLMKSHGFFSFIVPPGLLLVFPELSLVHCDRADTVDKCEEKDSREE